MQLLTNIQNQGQAYDYFTEYCLNQLVPNMLRDVSKYAPNRYRLWLINEPYLGRQPRLTSAYQDPYLQKVIQWLYPGCNTALISYHYRSQEFYSNAQITHHRDARDRFCSCPHSQFEQHGSIQQSVEVVITTILPTVLTIN